MPGPPRYDLQGSTAAVRPHTIQRVLADGPAPARLGRRYPPYAEIADPAEALGWVHGRVRTPEELERLFRLRSGRVIDRGGYVRFRDWRLYGERGLVKQPAAVWLCGETITLEHEDEPLSQFTVQFAPDKRHFTEVRDPRLFETRFASPQPFLWDMSDIEWRLVRRARPYRLRRKWPPPVLQLALFP
jgi:hypothetical protein